MDVSVVIPTYNRADLLKLSVESALCQAGLLVEVIVVDDGSTDDTATVLAEFGVKIRVERQPNSGACVARNHGFSLARGRWVKFLDSDDFLEPDSISSQIADLERSGFDVSYGMWKQEGVPPSASQPMAIMPLADPVDSLLSDWWCANSAYLISRQQAARVSWDPSLGSAQDFDYILNLALNGARFVHTSRLVASYRHHGGPRVSRRRVTDSSESRQRVLGKAEMALTGAGMLTERRRQLLALGYYQIAQNVFAFDRNWFRSLVRHAQMLSPGFMPPKPIHARLVRLVGFEMTEQLLHFRRRWRGILNGV